MRNRQKREYVEWWRLIKQKRATVEEALEWYDQELDDLKEAMNSSIDKLVHHNEMLPGLIYFYNSCHSDCVSFLDRFKTEYERVKSQIHASYGESSPGNVKLSATQLAKYVETHEDVKVARELVEEFSRLVRRFEGGVTALNNKGYTLTNLRHLVVHNLEDSEGEV